MEYYRAEHIRNHVLSKFNKPIHSPELRQEVSIFLSPEYIINRYKMKEVHLENIPYYSFLISEDLLTKHLLSFNLKFDKSFLMSRFKKFKVKPEECEISSYPVTSFPVLFNEIVYNHQKQEHIQQLAQLKRDAVQLHKDRKDYFNSVLMTDMPENIDKSRILSIDFEYSNTEIFELGLSFYNEGVITNRYFITNLKTGTREHQFRFNFGDSIIIPEDKMITLLEHYLKKADYVLLHGGLNDLFLLAKHNINLSDYSNLKLLDTYHLYANHFNDNNYDNTSLTAILNKFSIPYSHLHNAGNDASYTLQALLHMNKALNDINYKPDDIKALVTPLKAKPKFSL